MTTVHDDDKRLIPEFGPIFWCERTSERKWHYCKYCHRDVPTFKFAEGVIGWTDPVQVLRSCWECGSGLDVLKQTPVEEIAERVNQAEAKTADPAATKEK